MDKVERLLYESRRFRREICMAALRDWTLIPWLLQMLVLFRRIERGEITPPAYGFYRWPFHLDHERYHRFSRLYHSGAKFQAALEDWRSLPSAKGLFPPDDP